MYNFQTFVGCYLGTNEEKVGFTKKKKVRRDPPSFFHCQVPVIFLSSFSFFFKFKNVWNLRDSIVCRKNTFYYHIWWWCKPVLEERPLNSWKVEPPGPPSPTFFKSIYTQPHLRDLIPNLCTFRYRIWVEGF